MQQKIHYIIGLVIVVIVLLTSAAMYSMREKQQNTFVPPSVTEEVHISNENYESPYTYGFSAPYVDLSNLHAFARTMGESNNSITCGNHTLTFKPAEGQSIQADDLPIFLDDKQIASGNMAVFSKTCKEVIYNVKDYNNQTELGLHLYDIPVGRQRSISWHERDLTGVEIAGEIYKPVLDYIFPINSETLLLSFEKVTTGRDVYTNFSSQYYFDIPSGTLTFIEIPTYSRPLLLDKDHLRLIWAVYVADDARQIEHWDIPAIEYIELIGSKKPAKLDLLKPVHSAAIACDTSLSPADFAVCVDGFYTAVKEAFKARNDTSSTFPVAPKTTAFIKDMYEKNGAYFVALDFVTQEKCNPKTYKKGEDGNSCSDNGHVITPGANSVFKRVGSQPKTYELSGTAKIQLLKSTDEGWEYPIVLTKDFYSILKEQNGGDYYGLNFVSAPANDSENVYNNSYGLPFGVEIEGGVIINKLVAMYQA